MGVEPRTRTGRGFGKLLLFGEHAAVYGAPAIGIRLEQYLQVTIEADRTPSAAGGWRVPGVPEREAELIARAAGSVLTSSSSTGNGNERRDRGGTIRVDGTLPTSVGLGSSAAFCTALLRASGTERVDRRLWHDAHELEHIFHGTPSGIDTGLSIYDGASLIRTRPPELPTREPVVLPPATLVAAAIDRTRSTAELVAGIREMRERDLASVAATLRALGSLANEVARGSVTTAAELGRLANAARRHLDSLGLSTPELGALLDALLDAGATGAKLSGAGGGGAFYGVFEDAASAGAALARLDELAERAHILLRYRAVISLATSMKVVPGAGDTRS